MNCYTINFTDGGECWDLGYFANDTEAAIHAELVLAARGYDPDELVTGEWQEGRLLIWENEADATNNGGPNALCSIERCSSNTQAPPTGGGVIFRGIE